MTGNYKVFFRLVRLEKAREPYFRARAEPEPGLAQELRARALSSLAKISGPGPNFEPEPRLEQSLLTTQLLSITFDLGISQYVGNTGTFHWINSIILIILRIVQ